MINKMCRKKMAESILNHALGIIYLLTGEEYTIVKKNSPHSSIHQLTGEVPIKCDDVAVYFSMEEWEYITGHKELYKDVILEDLQINKNLEPSADVNTGTVSTLKDGEYDKDKETRQTGSKTELQDGNLDSVLSIDEDEIEEKDILQVVIKSEPYAGEVNTDIIIHSDHKEDLYQSSQSEAPVEEICDNISTGIYDDNLDTVSMSEEGQDEREENDIQQVVIKPEPSAEHSFPKYRFASWNMSETAVGTADEMVEPDLAQRIQGEWDENSPKASTSYGKGSPQSTPVSYVPEQAISSSSMGLHYSLNDRAWKEMQRTPEFYGQDINIKSEFAGHPATLREATYECNQLFSSQSSLYESQRKLIDPNPNTCNVCGKYFAKKFNLVVHERSHTGERPFSCDECGKQFSSKSTLHVHEKIHTGEKPHRCNHCGKHFAHKYYLLIHERLHTGEKPHMCNECGKHFAKKSNMVVHERSHTGEKPYRCNECGKQFAHKPHLIIHERAHTGEKPHGCDQCEKQFTYKSSLLAHQKKHTGEKPHRCDDCGKGFTKKGNLEVHKRSHTGEKPYSCNECGKQFTYKPQLLRHYKLHKKDDTL